MNNPNCLDPTTLQALLEQSLSADRSLACEQHLDTCDHCRQTLELLAGETNWWQEAAELLSTNRGFSHSKHDAVNNAAKSININSNSVHPNSENSNSPNSNSLWPALNSDRDAKTATLTRVRQLLTPGHPELLGRLAEYDIESFIGQGGFGVVLRAFDRELNRTVAIKILAPHLATIGAARRRFIREAQAAAAVVHPNVVPIHAVRADAEHPFLVMTYVPGCSLQEYVLQQGPLEPQAVVRIAQQVAAGLAAAHRQGLVHRDIKPGNILLENGLSRALITDFGLARAADDAASQTGWLAGTPHYMSPEQAASENLDGRSDLFSLGSVMYFMATGREPFQGTQPLAILNQIVRQKPPSVRSINAEIPRTLARVIERLLEKNPNDRIQSASQLSELLEQYLAHLRQPDLRTKPRLPVNRNRRRWLMSSLLVGASILLTTAVACYGWYVHGKPSHHELTQSESGEMERLGLEDSKVAGAMASLRTADQKDDHPETKTEDFHVDSASKNYANRDVPQILAVDDPRMQQWVELQRSEATWMVEGTALSQEIAALSDAFDQAEQRMPTQDIFPSSALPEAINEDQQWQRSVFEIDRMLREIDALSSKADK